MSEVKFSQRILFIVKIILIQLIILCITILEKIYGVGLYL